MSLAPGVVPTDEPPVTTAAITTLEGALVEQVGTSPDGERFVMHASSPHAADWGRALSGALELLTAKVALRDGVEEAHALVGRTVTLRVDPAGPGVRIVLTLVPVHAADAVPDPEPELDLGIG